MHLLSAETGGQTRCPWRRRWRERGGRDRGRWGAPCTSLYQGESGYSAFTRALNHLVDLEGKVKDNAMVRHTSFYHQGKED